MGGVQLEDGRCRDAQLAERVRHDREPRSFGQPGDPWRP